MGQASTYRQETADYICEQLAEGVSLREICRGEGMPAWRTVYDWMEASPEFAAAIARARIAGFDAIAAETLEIADDARNDWMEKRKGEDVDLVVNAEHVQRSKLRIETRLKLLAKWDPKRYGERMDVNHSGQIDLASRIAAARNRTETNE